MPLNSIYKLSKLSIVFILVIASNTQCISSAKKTGIYCGLGKDNVRSEIIYETRFIDFGNKEHARLLMFGWGGTEKGHTWAIGKKAVLHFYTFHPKSTKILSIKCKPLGKISNQEIRFVLNGHPLGKLILQNKLGEYKINIPSKFQRKYRNTLEMIFKGSLSPSDYSNSRDNRKLAVDFISITFKPANVSSTVWGKQIKSKLIDYKNGYVSLPPNSMLTKYIHVKPDTNLDLHVKTNNKLKSHQVKVIARYNKKNYMLFKSNLDTKKIKKTIDLTKYANKIIKLGILHEAPLTLHKKDETNGFVNINLNQRKNQEKSKQPNLLFIVVDSLRSDHLGCHGGKVRTPNIDKLAKDGILFSSAYCHIPITLPSYASQFTSQYPNQTGVLNNYYYVHPQKLMLSELLNTCGFRTLGVTSTGKLNKYMNINQGFQVYNDLEPGFKRTSYDTTLVLLNYFKTLSNKNKWFRFINYAAPHEQYCNHNSKSHPVWVNINGIKMGKVDISKSNVNAFFFLLKPGKNVLKFISSNDFILRKLSFGPKKIKWEPVFGINIDRDTWRIGKTSKIFIYNDTEKPIFEKMTVYMHGLISESEIKTRYKKEVEYLDNNIGKLIGALKQKKQLQNTIIIFTSDHGESLGEHGLIGHDQQLYNSLIHVPLIISYPSKLPKSKKINQNVRHIDILPTIFDIYGIEMKGYFRGKSLMPLINGEDQENRPVLSMTFQPEAKNNLVSLIEDEFKIIKNMDTNKVELYNLSKDSKEINNITKKDAAKLRYMQKRLKEMMHQEDLSFDFF